uniref:pancreatic secretory granule membrane major glycoprotein GP2-like n=1 Tax=Styela clava TaxID=7725 RepID=UPI00193AD955|nr:pancreatic secretory granule membrane major glycoprotein GP2-like [Styela clava]
MAVVELRRGTLGITSLRLVLVSFFVVFLARADEHEFLRGLDLEEEEEEEIDERLRDFSPSTQHVELQCYTSSMCVALAKSWLNKNWGVKGKEQLTLLQRCDGSVEENKTHIILCTQKGRLTSCGTKFTQNDTHATFSNNVHILRPPSPTDGLVPIVRATIPWTCTYPMKLLVGVNFVPQISPVTVFLGNKTGYGVFEAAMFLYRDQDYKKLYDTTPKLHITDKLRVKVQLLRGPTNSRMQIYKCWGTAVEFPRDEDLTFTLIDEFCPSEEGVRAEVKLQNNGDQQHVLWESNVFRFLVGPEVFIHCHVKVCFAEEDCEKTCPDSNNQRERREVESPGSGLLSLGPINIGRDVPEIPSSLAEVEVTSESPNDVSESKILGLSRIAVFAVVGGLSAICFISIIAVAIAVYRKTRKREEEKTSQYWKDQAAARCRLSARFTLSNTPPFEIPISVPNTIAAPDRRGSNTSQ